MRGLEESKVAGKIETEIKEEEAKEQLAIDQYAEQITSKLQALGYVTTIQKITKNNDLVLTGITIRKNSNDLIAPTVYVDHYYHHNELPESAANDIVKSFEAALNTAPNITTEQMISWDYIKSHLTMRLINRNFNKNLLEEVPYIPVLEDLAVIFCVTVKTSDNTFGSYKISNQLLECIKGLDESFRTPEYLFSCAKSICQEILPYEIRSLKDMLCELIPDDILIERIFGDDESFGMPPMYVITNKERMYGAASILYENTALAELAEKLNDDLIILPSSIHECICLPASLPGLENMEPLSALIQSVNDTEVADDEVLSTHPYIYNRATNAIYADSTIDKTSIVEFAL